MDACPIQLDIPKYIEHIKDAKFAESLTVIRERLPLSGTVGRVCPRPCENYCRRGNEVTYGVFDNNNSCCAIRRLKGSSA